MYEIDDMGIKKVMEEAIRIAGEGTDGIHVSAPPATKEVSQGAYTWQDYGDTR